MKIFRLSIVGLALTTFFVVSIMGQTEKKPDITPVKFAAVDTKAFEDEKSGIKDLIIAYDELETELKPQINELQALSLELQKRQKELSEYGEVLKKDRLGCGDLYSKVKVKFEEYNKLYGEFESKHNDFKSLREKYKSEIVTPVEYKIGNALKQFAREKGYMMILDSSQNNSSTLIEEEPVDITKEFIKFYNHYSEKENGQ